MSIKSLLNQSLTKYIKTGYSADGRVSFSASSTIKARIEPKQKRVLQPDGSILVSDAVAMVLPDVSINTDDKLSYNGVDYKVIDIFEVPGETGDTHHKELKLQKWPS